LDFSQTKWFIDRATTNPFDRSIDFWQLTQSLRTSEDEIDQADWIEAFLSRADASMPVRVAGGPNDDLLSIILPADTVCEAIRLNLGSRRPSSRQDASALTVSSWTERFHEKTTSAEKAVKRMKSGARIFIGTGCAEPQLLVKRLAETGQRLADTEIIHILSLGVAPYAEPKFKEHFRANSFFIGTSLRGAVGQGRADYTPIFLSDIPRLLRSGRFPVDVALIQVSPPDEHGYCSLGISVDIVKTAAEVADMVIAEVNSQMPRTLGDSFIHANDIDLMVESNTPILEYVNPTPDELSRAIGRQVARLIGDGDTIEAGIGEIPDAVLKFLTDKKDLGIHTEMFTDGIIDLVESGVITNRKKTIHRGKIVASFCMGTRRLYKFVDNNPLIEFHPTEYVNDPYVIARNDNMVAINSAIQVDLTGQVCADSIGHRFYSGIGGQVDFIRGAARSRGGKPIIALPSTTGDGSVSRIVPHLDEGAGVVTTRGDVHYIVTEHGIAYLHGKTIRDRALALINVADPKFRPWLLGVAKQLNYVPPDQAEPRLRFAGYPEELERTVTLKNNLRVLFRPVKPTDETAMKDLFYSFSEDTIYHRFFGVLKSMPHSRLQHFVNVDYDDRMGIAAVVGEPGSEQMVALATYDLEKSTNMAEVAIVVHDDWQNLGLGTELLRYLARVARQHGIGGFTAEVLADNPRAMKILHKTGYPIESKMIDGTYQVIVRF